MNSPFIDAVGQLPPEDIIFGTTPAILEIRDRLRKIAATNVPVLLEGESGTGKDVIAKFIHRISPWRNGPFVKISCPAIPASLLESELFGYEKGAFTGANADKRGRVELASRGTLFLDEIAELDMSIQAKLLQVLQDGQFCRVGASADTKVETRIICATNRSLAAEVQAGRFRQDLIYRINVVSVQLPPLRQRAQDIPEVLNYLLRLYSERFNRRPQPISRDAVATLQAYPWPGNIRELENFVKRYVIIGAEAFNLFALEQLPKQDFAAQVYCAANGDGASLKTLTREAARQVERQVILRSLQANNWNRKHTARALKISYRALLYKMRDAGPALVRATAHDGD